MGGRATVTVFIGFIAVSTGLLTAQDRPARRASLPHSDLQGLWTTSTATPLQRPAEFSGKAFLTEAEAREYERTAFERLIASFPEEDRTAGDLNDIYLDTDRRVVEDRRTALIVSPSDGRLPPQLPAAEQRAAKLPPRSFDNPETLTLDERCLLETALGSSNAAPPMVPNPFGANFYQIVQTANHVLIFTELVHDARIIRIGGQHLPSPIRLWLGDSIGHWEGDTLVVDTTNFTDKTHYRGSGERLHVVERFTRTSATAIRYQVTVDDPETWATSWTAEIPFTATHDRIFEYACHEANYSLENSLRGARAADKPPPR